MTGRQVRIVMCPSLIHSECTLLILKICLTYTKVSGILGPRRHRRIGHARQPAQLERRRPQHPRGKAGCRSAVSARSAAAAVARLDERHGLIDRRAGGLWETNMVLSRLHFLGFVRPDRCHDHEGPGRPASRWLVNPALKE